MKVFITGGAGYIGAHLIKALLLRGHSIHALVRNRKKFIFSVEENVVLFEGDFMNYDKVVEAMSGCDQVYHLGGCASIWEKDTGTYFQINVQGTKNVLDAALSLEVERIVYTSTAGVLGPSVSGIVSEGRARDVGFFNEYEESKSEAESLINTYVTEKGMDVIVVAPTRVYGPYLHGTPASFTLMIEKYLKGNWRIIPGDGSKIGNYIFIDDVVEGHISAMEKGKPGHTYILGGENNTYNYFFKSLKEVSGKNHWLIKVPIAFQMWFARITYVIARLRGVKPILTTKWVVKGNYHWEISVEKAKRDLGLKTTPLKVGLLKTAAWCEVVDKQ